MESLDNLTVEQLKQQLDDKMDEFRTIYNKLMEFGGVELPEDFLDMVNGGIWPLGPSETYYIDSPKTKVTRS